MSMYLHLGEGLVMDKHVPESGRETIELHSVEH